MDTTAKRQLASRVAARLAEVEGVVAVVLGGSLASGEGHPNSDVDLGIYYDPEARPSIPALRALAKELDDRHADDLVTDFGGWGPWIDGGGWLEIEGVKVDWLYRDLTKVQGAIADCLAGEPTCHYQPGHPHGFWTTIYAGEVHLCRPLHDPEGAVEALKACVDPYPPELRRAMVATLWEAEFALATAQKSIARGEASYVAGCFYRCVATLVQVLFALEGRYCINEKGGVAWVETFARKPAGFQATVEAVMGAPGHTPEALAASAERLGRLLAETRALAEAAA